jgi:hypothetical protein
MTDQLRERLLIPGDNLGAINDLLANPKTTVVNDLLEVVKKYGGPEEINRKAEQARALPNLLRRLDEIQSPYRADLDWLIAQRDTGAFIGEAEYRRKVLGPAADTTTFADDFAVTLEISAFQYFPWLIAEARQAIARQELMPGRYIRVRKMKESEADPAICWRLRRPCRSSGRVTWRRWTPKAPTDRTFTSMGRRRLRVTSQASVRRTIIH